jgi:hypothetical protein
MVDECSLVLVEDGSPVGSQGWNLQVSDGTSDESFKRNPASGPVYAAEVEWARVRPKVEVRPRHVVISLSLWVPIVPNESAAFRTRQLVEVFAAVHSPGRPGIRGFYNLVMMCDEQPNLEGPRQSHGLVLAKEREKVRAAGPPPVGMQDYGWWEDAGQRLAKRGRGGLDGLLGGPTEQRE